MKDYIINPQQEKPLKIFKLSYKFLGLLDSSFTFRRTVRLSKHLYRKLDAFGIDDWIIRELKAFSCKEIEIFDKEESYLYKISFDSFLKHSRLIDHGFGVQLVCPRKFFFKAKKEDEPRLFNCCEVK